MSLNYKSRLSLAAAAIGLGALAGCGTTRTVEARQGTGQAGAASASVPTVAVAKVTRADLSRNLVLTAEFIPYQEIDVMAKVAGYVKQINVDIGDRVKQGQLLAVLEIPEMTDELAKGKASIQRSEAQVTQAQDEVRRAEATHKMAHLSADRLGGVAKNSPGLVAQQEVDDAQGKDMSAEAQVQAAKSNLAAAQQQVDFARAELARLQTMFGYTKVIAPFDGVITKRYANTGSMIQAGTASQTQAMPLVRLSQNLLLRLILPVPESAVPTVHVGQQVDVRVPTLNRTFPGRVARFEDKLQLSTRTMNTEVDVQNPNRVLIPGMYAEVDLTLKAANSALCIPINAVDLEQNNARVMVVTPENRLEPRNITTGLETADRVEVRSGLSEGETVVIGNRSGLQKDEVVKPRPVTLMAKEDPSAK